MKRCNCCGKALFFAPKYQEMHLTCLGIMILAQKSGEWSRNKMWEEGYYYKKLKDIVNRFIRL